MNFFKNSVVLILVCGLFAFAQGQGKFAAKLGINFSGEYELDGGDLGTQDGSVKTGFEANLEYYYPTSPQLIIGGGAGFLLTRESEDSPDDFSIIPIYGLIKYEIQSEGSFVPALEGRIGYNFLNYNSGDDNVTVDATGGLHYGFALSGTFNKQYLVGIGYYVYNTSADVTAYGFSGSGDASYSCITLSVGMIFGGAK